MSDVVSVNNQRTLSWMRENFSKSSISCTHVMKDFNVGLFMIDQHPAAIHAREWGKRKPWHLTHK